MDSSLTKNAGIRLVAVLKGMGLVGFRRSFVSLFETAKIGPGTGPKIY